MKTSDVMTRNVLTVGRETSVANAIRVMLDHNVSGLPVLDNGKVVGIVTEGDLLRRSETGTERHRPRWLEILMGPGRMAGEYVRTHGRRVEEIMTTDVISVAGDTPLDEVVGLMERRRIKRVPVIEGDVLVGVVSRLDLLRAVLRAIEAQYSEDRSDDDIREQILAELAKAAWVPRDGLSISVKDGVVDLDGVILEEKEREALRVVAENVPGVTAVEDHLVWIEPVSGTVIEPPQDQRTHADKRKEAFMRSFTLGLVATLALAAGLQHAGATPSLRNSDSAAHVSQSLVLVKHHCGKGQYWVPAGYAKHGKYRAAHCAPR